MIGTFAEIGKKYVMEVKVMKLAEALIVRSDVQKRIEQMKVRLSRSAKVQEGEKPPERPNELLKEMGHLLTELNVLIKRINRTNAQVIFENDTTLADALADRDTLGLRRNILNDLMHTASIKQDRYTKSEVRFLATVNIGTLQEEMDHLAKTYRELDTRIQELNWKTDLID